MTDLNKLIDVLKPLGVPTPELLKLFELLDKEKDMGPILTIFMQFLPQLIESLIKKEVHAAKNGYEGPWTVFMNAPGVKEGIAAATKCYERCDVEITAANVKK